MKELDAIESVMPEAEAALCASPEGRERVVLSALKEAVPYLIRCSKGLFNERQILSFSYEALAVAIKTYRPGGIRFFAYAKQALRGRLYAETRNLDVVKNSSIHEAPESSGEPLEVDSDPFDFDPAHYNDLYEQIKPIIEAKLSAQEQTILALRFRENYGFEEIGQLTGSNRAAAQATCRRALKKVRMELYRTKRLFNT